MRALPRSRVMMGSRLYGNRNKPGHQNQFAQQKKAKTLGKQKIIRPFFIGTNLTSITIVPAAIV
jgi:hypothetical protein